MDYDDKEFLKMFMLMLLVIFFLIPLSIAILIKIIAILFKL